MSLSLSPGSFFGLEAGQLQGGVMERDMDLDT